MYSWPISAAEPPGKQTHATDNNFHSLRNPCFILSVLGVWWNLVTLPALVFTSERLVDKSRLLLRATLPASCYLTDRQHVYPVLFLLFEQSLTDPHKTWRSAKPRFLRGFSIKVGLLQSTLIVFGPPWQTGDILGGAWPTETVAFRLGRIESPQLATRQLKDFTRIYPRVPVSQVGCDLIDDKWKFRVLSIIFNTLNRII